MVSTSSKTGNKKNRHIAAVQGLSLFATPNFSVLEYPVISSAGSSERLKSQAATRKSNDTSIAKTTEQPQQAKVVATAPSEAIKTSNMSPAKRILVGKGRRLTLAEIYAVSNIKEECYLEWQGESNAMPDEAIAVAHLLEGLQVESTSRVTMMTEEEQESESVASDTTLLVLLSGPDTLAFLTLLALSVAQGRSLGTAVASANAAPTDEELKEEESVDFAELSATLAQQAVLAVNTIKKKAQNGGGATMIRLPADPDVCLGILQGWSPATRYLHTAVLDRLLEMAVLSRAVFEATTLGQAALPIAGLSMDVSGLASSTLLVQPDGPLSEFALDVLRPHRSMSQAGALLRAFLNESKFKPAQMPSEYVSSIMDVPQYHGPAVEDLRAVSKRLELELNSQAVNAETVLDRTARRLAFANALESIQVLLQQSQDRLCSLRTTMAADADATTTKEKVEEIVDADAETAMAAAATRKASLAIWVQKLKKALLREARYAMAIVQSETAKAKASLESKEGGDKEQGNQANTGGSSAGKDEFAGMSDAQKAKILKKRAEKEAKAAAKKNAKKKKGGTIFGAGTLPLVQVFEEHSSSLLSVDCCMDIAALCEKLLSGGVQRKPKIPKGTRDYLPEQMMVRQQAFDIIRRVFQSHGAVEIDTPVFELKDTLTGKYGEDSKLIYDLADQGGELLALRYDLTVPFARFLSLNNVGNIKRFHIGKVYRRDQPALKRGRYREFYQCDFDIAGTYGRMVPDSECLAVACEILDSLPIGEFGIKLNHRRLLDAILDLCGVPAEKFRTICSAVDKLDKEPWEEVKREMVQDKGLDEEVADKIGTFVLRKGEPLAMYNELMDSKKFAGHAGAAAALEDLKILFEYLEAMNKLRFISFDLSLARGLDYYTGVIYEAVCMNGNTQVGSIGGGGRYDNLVGMFQEGQTPCVGVSVGIERVFTLMEARLREQNSDGSLKQRNVDVIVASAGTGLLKEKMKITTMLWDGHLRAEFSQSDKLKKELTTALDREIPFMVIVGEQEWKEKTVKVKDLNKKTEDTVGLDQLVGFLREKGVIPVGCEFAMEILQNDKS